LGQSTKFPDFGFVAVVGAAALVVVVVVVDVVVVLVTGRGSSVAMSSVSSVEFFGLGDVSKTVSMSVVTRVISSTNVVMAGAVVDVVDGVADVVVVAGAAVVVSVSGTKSWMHLPWRKTLSLEPQDTFRHLEAKRGICKKKIRFRKL
jgi:hypothetical protein